MWKINNDVASLQCGNRGKKLNVREWVYNAIVVSFCVLTVGGVVGYEHFTSDPQFDYGRDEDCVMAGKSGSLFLVIVPTFITIVVNLITTTYSGVTLYLYNISNPLIKENAVPRLMVFLIRMISFQGLQWVLGLVFH